MYEELKQVLVTNLKVDREVIRPTATLEDIELDSLAIVELSLYLESELGISISSEEIFGRTSLGDLAGLLEQQSGNV
ncbi:acyl carrier protein [Streptomyces sp. Ag109_O5-1]|uniref:acyl carrier protein n=1 Tax=Streptomyces sp. Ag109_O5-1 TaxID=1938851 RepID=UPI000F513046|nr:acyl carrier protein [Streptomyces sp. Ag109_O5-1]RPE39187.1 acyl carrier protein [Streptomyces sp. Ag109_O5-1]